MLSTWRRAGLGVVQGLQVCWFVEPWGLEAWDMGLRVGDLCLAWGSRLGL